MTTSWVEELTQRLAAWMPVEAARLVLAVGVLLLGYIVALILGRLVLRGFRNVSGRLMTMSRNAARDAGLPPPLEVTVRAQSATMDVSRRIVFWLVFSLFLGVAANVLGLPVFSDWLSGLAGYLPRVLASAVVVLLSVLVGSLVRTTVTAAASSTRFAHARSLGRAAQIAVVTLAVAVAIHGLGVEITLLIVIAAIVLGSILGAAALAFGLGAQDSVRNLLACHYLAKWYHVGQLVRVGEYSGRIVEVLPSAVVLETDAGQLYIPASEFAKTPSLLVADEAGE